MVKGREYILPAAQLEAATREQLKQWLEAGNISYVTYTTELSRRGKGLSTAETKPALTALKDALQELGSVASAYKDPLQEALDLAQQVVQKGYPYNMARSRTWYVKLADWLASKFGYVHFAEQQNAAAELVKEQWTLIKGLHVAERLKAKAAYELKQQKAGRQGYKVKVWGKQYQLCRKDYPLSTSKYYSTADNCLRSARKLAEDLGIELEIADR